MKIKSDQITESISRTLSEYAGATIDALEKAVDKASKDSVERLKRDSPVRTGAYAKSWTSKKTKQKNKWAYGKIVYNAKWYRLTHLLEYGHRKAGGGRVAARPHIEKVERDVVDEFIREVKEGI